MKNNLFMIDRENVQADFTKLEEVSKNDIAIIGIAGQFPMAENIEQLWSNLQKGVDCISGFPETRQNDCDRYLRFKGEAKVQYIKGAFLNDIDKFDYKFFKLSPKEASLMDPVQRLFLETAWQAIEDAGYGGRKLSGSKTGVYLGFEPSLMDSYGKMIYDVERSSLQICAAGNIPAIIPSRISYILDLKGPTISIDTACSSSLVAVHLACQAIRCGDCDMAVAGGVKIYLFPVHNPEEKLGIESTDFLTKSFDERSDGTGSGEGVAAIILKPLSEALKDKDDIYAVIKGSAINQDGSSANLTAPNSLAQADVIEQAWKKAGIDPETISYIEAHGTGTKIGDPIEIDGITKAFERYTDKKQFCGVGSIKTNIGHLYEASGIVGLIKAALALKYAELPPNIHFKIPNQKIFFEDSPVYVIDKLTPWETDGYPRRCGVNAFGFSGTNCHVILEENLSNKNETTIEVNNDEPLYIFTISAKSITALNALVAAYYDYFNKINDLPVKNICYVTNTGRGHYNQRIAVIVQNYSELTEKLKQLMVSKVNESLQTGVYYGEHKIVGNKVFVEQNELTEKAKRDLTSSSSVKITLFLESEKTSRTELAEICRLYVKGADIDWNRFYEKERITKFRLPVYPFDKTRCWLEIPEVKQFEETGLYYTVKWKTEEGDCLESPGLLDESVILIKDSAHCKTIDEATVSFLRRKCRNLFEVEIGEEFKKINEQKFVIRNTEEDYLALFNELKETGFYSIIHALSLENKDVANSLDELNDHLDRGLYSLFYLTKALQKALIKEELKLYLISYCASEVTGREKFIKAENVALFGLGAIIEREYPEIRCKCIDVDDNFAIEKIYTEFVQDFQSGFVAFRDGKRYMQEFSEIDVSKYQSNKQIDIKDTGVYVITGGTGGLGLEVAKYLTSKSKVNLALLNRSKLPEREKWLEIINCGEDQKLCNKITAILEMEKNGSEVLCYSVDISNFNEMESVFNEIRSKHKKINGIVHAAGVPGHGFINQKSRQSFNQVIYPKIQGTWILAELTQNDDLDFFLMFSSVAATFGAPGQGDYTPANLYLDSFASTLNKNGRKALTIDWVQWLETGMAVETKANVNTIFKALPTRQGIDAFEKVLNSSLNRTLIGEIDYGNDMVLLLERYPIRLSEKIKRNLDNQKSLLGPSTKHLYQEHQIGEVNLKGRDNGEYTKMERMVAQVWGEVLGYKELNIDDNFFELGGDSILAIKIGNRISKLINKNLPISEALTMPTISDLSKYLEEIELNENEALYSSFKSFSA
jgi:3-oxoacyl-(acyl-carrier-protein) synthase/NAD(P)-dependent dehydrogenase (short-subunit alcohol dehydrogenase family)/acyl carrier protein